MFLLFLLGQYRIILSADTASEVRQLLSQKPRMNGWDAARTIRAMNRPDAEIIPIIAMSANAFSEDIMDSRLAGMDIHLAKPLDEAKMINALKQCIAERSAVKLRNDL